MVLFVALQRNRGTPGLYFSNSFESLHSPRGLKLFVHLRTQQYQCFPIWIISDFIKPRVPTLTTQSLPSKALAMLRTCAEYTVVKLWGASTCSSEPGSCRRITNRPEFFNPGTEFSAPLFEPLPNCSSKPRETAGWIKTENVHPLFWKLGMCASTFYGHMAVGGESPCKCQGAQRAGAVWLPGQRKACTVV